MKIRVLFFLVLVIFMLSQSVSASGWLFLQRLEGTLFGSCTEYFASDFVVQTEDRLTYWTVWVMDRQPGFNGVSKRLYKKEALLTNPMGKRNLAVYRYDDADKELSRFLTPGPPFQVQPASPDEHEINRVLEYAKVGVEADRRRPSMSQSRRTPIGKSLESSTVRNCTVISAPSSPGRETIRPQSKSL